MLNDVVNELSRIVENSKPSLCYCDRDFEDLYKRVEDIVKKLNVQYLDCISVYENRYRRLSIMISYLIDDIANKYRYDITDDEAENISYYIEKLIDVCFPIFASSNEVLADYQNEDYDIDDKSFLTINLSESLRHESLFELLKFLLHICKFNIFFKRFKKYRSCLIKRQIRSLALEIIHIYSIDNETIKLIDELDNLKLDENEQKRHEKKIEEKLQDSKNLSMYNRRLENELMYYRCKETLIKRTTFFDDGLKKSEYDTLTALCMLISEASDKKIQDDLVENKAKHFFIFLREIVSGIDDIAIEQFRKELGNVNPNPYDCLKEMKDNFNEDELKLNSLIGINDVINIYRFLGEYYIKYISALKAIAQIDIIKIKYNKKTQYDKKHLKCCFNSLKRLYISTLANEVGNFGGGLSYLDKEEILYEEEIKAKLYGIAESTKLIEKKIQLVLDEKFYNKYIEKLKNSDLGKLAINNKEKYVKEFLESAKDVYDFRDPNDNINDNDIKCAYKALAKNEKIMEYIAVGEYNFNYFYDIFPSTNSGDYTYMVVTFIKVIERYMKEVLAQHYVEKIYKLDSFGRQAEGELYINPNDLKNVDADYLSHGHDGTDYIYYSIQGPHFNGIECGKAYNLLLYIKNTLGDNNIKSRFDYKYRLNGMQTQTNTVDFKREWIHKVRNGYFHVDIISTAKAADINRRKTAFWLIHLTRCLPELYR